MKFWKMHGLGNDFAVFDARVETVPETAEWARVICDRRTGIGCDQVIIIKQPRNPVAHAYLRMLNADGSEPEACGNGTRCVASLLLPELSSPKFHLETLNGLLAVDTSDPGHIVVDMEKARLDWQEIPLAGPVDTLHVPITVDGFSGDAVCTNMGNPHATFFVDDLDTIDLHRIGPQIERHALFPRRANIGFAQMLSRNHMRFRIWERGSGYTLACGSGTCAAGVAAIRRGLADRRIIVDVEIGQLTVEWLENGHVLLGGPTALVFTGELN